MEQRINLITLVVPDLDAARSFYGDGLGWEIGVDVPGEVLMIKVGEKLVLSLWTEPGFEAEVGPIRRGEGLAPLTIAHNVAEREQVDEVLETARRAGAPYVSDPTEREWGGYSGYFADPAGFRWEVAWSGGRIGPWDLP